MKLSEVRNYIRSNYLERKYNKSMNSNKVNSVDNMFSSSKMIDKFFVSSNFSMTGNIDKEIKEKISYQKYYEFLSKEFVPNGYFSSFLKEKADYWKFLDPTIDIHDAVIYLLNVFVVSPVEGKIKEIKVEQKVREVFSNFTVTNPTPEEDLNQCWDLKLHNKDVCFYLQVKTRNFFKGLRGTSKYSFYKIEKAAKNYNLPIFFVKEDYGDILINLSNTEKTGNTEFILLESFDFEGLNQDEIFDLAFDTFSDMRKENGI